MRSLPDTAVPTRSGAARRRVLLLAESPYFGGITSHLVSIVDAFAGDAEFEPVVATRPGSRGDR